MKMEKEIQNKIEEFYSRNNYNESWRFLNCFKKNLWINNGIVIITLNPAARNINYTNQVKFSSESGFSSQAETAISKVQPQLKELLTEIHDKTRNTTSLEEFVNTALVGYFIPIRSSNFSLFKNKKELIDLGKELWTPILQENLDSLQLLVVIDKTTMKAVLRILSTIGLKVIDNLSLPIGWGNYNADILRFKFNSKTITLLRLPHLSRFSIFGREVSKNQINKIVKESITYCTFK